MKTSNVSPANPATSASPAKAPTASTEDGSDFMTLFAQVMDGNMPAGAAPASMLATAFPFGAGTQQDDTSDLDESEIAMMMAALAGAPALPAMPVNSVPVADAGNTDLLQSSSLCTTELAGAMVDMLASHSGGLDVLQSQDSAFDAALANTDASGNSTAIDPRLTQNALERQTEVPVQRQMHAPVGTRAWNDELGAQIHWMTERGHQSASLRLSPEHLGPLEIQISIQDDQASVWFGAAHADTRAAIENALPRLREMLASQGLALNDTGVFKEAPRQQSHFRPERGAGIDNTNAPEEAQSVGVSRLGLVDAYA